MKKLFIFLLVSSSFSVLFGQQSGFTLNGRFNARTAGTAYLYYSDNTGSRVKDSCTVREGTVTFSGVIDGPELAVIQYRPDSSAVSGPLQSWRFYIEPGDLSFSAEGGPGAFSLQGSSSQIAYEEFVDQFNVIEQEIAPFTDAYNHIYGAYSKAKAEKQPQHVLDTLKSELEAAKQRIDQFSDRHRKIALAYFDAHPSSIITADQLRYYVNDMPLDSLEMYYDRMDAEVKLSPTGRKLADAIGRLQAGSPGSQAFNFSAVDIHGAPIALADYAGKYVLLDFWASWCVPCRKGNPHLKALYNTYKTKGPGFEIIAISSDSDTRAWQQAIHTDGISEWVHLLSSSERLAVNTDNEPDIARHFAIGLLPTKLLISPDGVIIGRYYSDDGTLDKQLETLLAN